MPRSIGVPSGVWKRARRAVRGGEARKSSTTRATQVKQPCPLTRITAKAERPGGVASAAMGSVSMAGARSGLTLFLLDHRDRRPRPHGWRRVPLDPLAGQQPLLRDARDVAQRIVQVE